ncbi:hypothetical protein AGMMS4957_13110 [Bacteroidia bacterium]|nr:hypothetical protein AGMMS4957_13110 [Bacteroidia bacterium]
MPLFPPEIINDTTEALFVKRSVHSKAIYLVVVFAVAATLAALPFIYVQVSTQARGTIRTPNENNPLQTSVYGEVTDIRIAENAEVLRGDTLLVECYVSPTDIGYTTRLILQLKNGYKGNLKKGMTLTGRFYLTDRSLWQLLFDKVDNWVNPKIV